MGVVLAMRTGDYVKQFKEASRLSDDAQGACLFYFF